mgnify:CR=1 FL=1
MRTKYLITFLMTLMMASTVMAASSLMPQPVVIRISQPVVTEVTITNTYTGEVQLIGTGSDGATVFDLSNLEKGVVTGAVIKVEALGTSTTFTHTGQPYYDVFIDLGSKLASKCVLTESLDYGGNINLENEECQVYVTARAYEPVVCTLHTQITDGTVELYTTECDIKIDPPTPNNDNIVIGFLGLLAGLFGGGLYGIKFRKKQDGTTVGEHYHAGIRGYHDINIQHKNTAIKHPKGQLNPKYEKDSKGNWKYVG